MFSFRFLTNNIVIMQLHDVNWIYCCCEHVSGINDTPMCLTSFIVLFKHKIKISVTKYRVIWNQDATNNCQGIY